MLIVTLGSLCLAAQNVLLRVIFAESSMLGRFNWGGLIPSSSANSLLVLQMGSVLILPTMMLLPLRLYPSTTETLRHLAQPPSRPTLYLVLNFAVMALLSTFSLLLVAIEVSPRQWEILSLISLITAGPTLLGQRLYNIGINLVRAASMSIVAVSNPVFTVIIAWLFLQESLQSRQILGLLLAVFSIVALGQEKPQRLDAASP